jgi:hypothetical protein
MMHALSERDYPILQALTLLMRPEAGLRRQMELGEFDAEQAFGGRDDEIRRFWGSRLPMWHFGKCLTQGLEIVVLKSFVRH